MHWLTFVWACAITVLMDYARHHFGVAANHGKVCPTVFNYFNWSRSGVPTDTGVDLSDYMACGVAVAGRSSTCSPKRFLNEMFGMKVEIAPQQWVMRERERVREWMIMRHVIVSMTTRVVDQVFVSRMVVEKKRKGDGPCKIKSKQIWPERVRNGRGYLLSWHSVTLTDTNTSVVIAAR